MKHRALLFALFCLSYLYYVQRTSGPDRPLVPASISFHVPHIVHESIPKGYQYVYHNSLTPGSSVFLGKFKWCDSLRIPGDAWKYDHNPEDIVYDFIWRGKDEKFKTDGFQLVPDYASTIFYSSEPVDSREGEVKWTYYPVYLVNETAETKYFILKHHHVYAIQEAMDNEAIHVDTWWPIEYNNQDGSGFGLSALKVYPGEFVLFIVPRYMGPVLTKLRIRLKNGDNIIVSNPYDGHIYPNQILSDPGTPLHFIIRRNEINSFQDLFLGALPKETEPERS